MFVNSHAFFVHQVRAVATERGVCTLDLIKQACHSCGSIYAGVLKRAQTTAAAQLMVVNNVASSAQSAGVGICGAEVHVPAVHTRFSFWNTLQHASILAESQNQRCWQAFQLICSQSCDGANAVDESAEMTWLSLPYNAVKNYHVYHPSLPASH